ncbi:MAG: serine/threonine protein kinase [Myxococcota bacterium]
MNCPCVVCFAELSPDAESCFSCGTVRGIQVNVQQKSVSIQGITIAGEARENVVLRPEALPAGITFSNRFTIQEELSHTPLWFRYLAVDLDRGLEVELRTLREDDAESQGWQAMRYMQRYQGHPNLLGFMYVDLESTPPYAISDIQNGIQLSQFLNGRGGRIPMAESVILMQDLLIGLAALHEEGHAHADIHPDSIWLDSQGRPKLDGGGPFGRRSVSIYAAPEQLEGGELSPQSDIYAMGLLWYRILTGELPFASLETEDIQAYPHLSQKDLAPLSARLAPVVRKMLHPDPSQRPSNAQALLRELRDVFRKGWFNIPELSRSELGKRSSSNRLWLQGTVIAANDTLRLLNSGAATGTAALVGGKVLLKTSAVALTEAGLQALLPQELRQKNPAVQTIVDILVHDVLDRDDRLKQAVAHTVRRQVEMAQLAWMLNQPVIARNRLGAAIQMSANADDWCHVAEVLVYFEDPKASREALQQALQQIKCLDDVLQVAAVARWMHNDHGATKRVLSRGANWINSAQDALKFAAAWMALLLDLPSAKLVLNTVLENAVREAVLVQCDHLQEAIRIFGPDDIWIQWLQRIQTQAQSPNDWERITWLWQHLKQPKLAALARQEGQKVLDLKRQRIETENTELGISLELPELSIAAVDAFERKSLELRMVRLKAQESKNMNVINSENEESAVHITEKNEASQSMESSVDKSQRESLSVNADPFSSDSVMGSHTQNEQTPFEHPVEAADKDSQSSTMENNVPHLNQPLEDGSMDDSLAVSVGSVDPPIPDSDRLHVPHHKVLVVRIVIGLILCGLAFWLMI